MSHEERGIVTSLFKSMQHERQVAAQPTQHTSGQAEILDVEWKVGRQGRLTPVGLIAPLLLAGTNCNHVSLHSLSWIQDMKLAIGSRVTVCRCGKLAPQVVAVVN